jgi:tetratricopeptide (TPR) repeat protein
MIRALVILCLLSQMLAAQALSSPESLRQVNAGLEAERENRFESAIAAFSRATELAPSEPNGFVYLGRARMESGQYAEAVTPLRRALELDAENLTAHQLLGYALLAQGYAAEAIPHLERVHDRGALGIAQIETDQLNDAVANLLAALARSPNDPDLLYYLSRASGMLSTKASNLLIERLPNSARAHQLNAQNYVALRQMPQAEKEYKQALALRPDVPELHLELGNVYADSSLWPQAEQEFRIEAERQPGNAEAAYRLGNALLQQGKSPEAFRELRRSDRLRPDTTDTLYALGKAAFLCSDDGVAERAWKRVVEVEGGSALAAQAHFSLAGLYRRQRKPDLAEKEMREFRRLRGPEDARATIPQAN